MIVDAVILSTVVIVFALALTALGAFWALPQVAYLIGHNLTRGALDALDGSDEDDDEEEDECQSTEI